MYCKHCGAENPQEQELCQSCGKPLLEEEIFVQTQQVVPEEETVMEIPEETEETLCEPEEKPKKKIWAWILAGVAGLAVLTVLAIFLLSQFGVKIIRDNDILYRDAYLVSDEKAEKAADKVVAKIGDKELTNAQLQIYYKMQVQDFLSYYGSYLSSVGFDYTKPLGEQESYFDPALTWEQYFLKMALETWQNYQTLEVLAEEADFSMSEAWQEEFDKIPESLETQAKEDGYESAQEMVEEALGAGCTVADYVEYVRLLSVSGDFYASEYQRLTPTEEETETYFTENEKLFEENGITKESGLISSVRHILISPEGGTENEETGETTYSDAEWKAAEKEAEKLLQQWKDGKATEESFAELVADNTDDSGSAATGGLYENITPNSSYVEEFLAWAVDMSRKTGDTGIVKTEFGYHIMYFVSGEPQWQTEASTMLLAERTTAMIDDAEKKWPMKVNYRKIVLTALDLA